MKKIFILATVIVSGMALGLAQAEEGDKGGKGKGKGKGGDPAARADAMLKKLDTDGSGGISLEEFAAAPKGDKSKGKEGMLDKMFEMRDTNSDGELDKSELSKPREGGKGGKKGKGGKGAEDAE
ncbi:MAG: EF-hand domain-containing protein [Verrucomicrobiales bacterium]|nr:EF-hand domain-containing protein [Verrucomicrobiales bacterium]